MQRFFAQVANRMRKRLLIFFFSCVVFSLASNANAENFLEFLDRTQVSGDVRMYNFTKNFSNPNVVDENSFSLGGGLNLLTEPFLTGFQAGISYYVAESLGLNSDNALQVDRTLPGSSVNVLGQAYLQYKKSDYLIRVGDQLIVTPWLSPSDSRMIPATYQGVYASYSPWQDFDLIALRVFQFKGWVAHEFSRTNLYNTNNAGGRGIPRFGTTPTNGVLAFGTSYKLAELKTQAWYYQFYDLANMAYVDAHYKFVNHSQLNPFIGAQLLREWGSGNNALSPFAGGAANSTMLGALVGLEVSSIEFAAAYNHIPVRRGSFFEGDILSPYTAGYATDPLFTTSMIAGLVDKSSGDAVKFSATYFAFERQLRLVASYAKYYTKPSLDDTNEFDFDVTYSFMNQLKGLSLRNRLGVLHGNPVTGRFIYNRVMLQYSF